MRTVSTRVLRSTTLNAVESFCGVSALLAIVTAKTPPLTNPVEAPVTGEVVVNKNGDK